MNTLQIKRGSDLLQTLYYDLTGGNFNLVLVDELPNEDQQPIVYVPERVNILMATPTRFVLNEAGHWVPEPGSQEVKIQVLWKQLTLSNAGKVLGESNAGQSMESVDIDVQFFMQYQGLPIILSMVNGRIRAIDGYNYYPPFDSLTGAVINYPDEATAVKSLDYKEKKADGTWIHPELHPEPVVEPAPEPVTTSTDATTA